MDFCIESCDILVKGQKMIQTLLEIIALAILGIGIGSIPGFSKIGDRIYGLAIFFFFVIIAKLILSVVTLF